MIDIVCTAAYPCHTIPVSPDSPCMRPMGHGGLHRAFSEWNRDGDERLSVFEFTDDLRYVGQRAITPEEKRYLIALAP